ncbi:type I methionyl aminopeptidase [Candidatus Latescibacterota bacterium]
MIAVRTPPEIDRIRASCQIVYLVQQVLGRVIEPGISTLELDRLAEKTIREQGAVPAFKGYGGFPASICASINAEAVHGFPREAPLQDGDVLSIDVGVELDGYFGDGAFTLAIGTITDQARHLLDTTRAALADAIQATRAGGRLSDISHAIESRARAGRLSVIREYGGHGIGRSLHEEPHIPNYGEPGRGPILKAGYIFAVEPILSLGGPEVEVEDDGWTTLTVDRTPAAHFEHTIAITDEGADILTLPSDRQAAPQAWPDGST